MQVGRFELREVELIVVFTVFGMAATIAPSIIVIDEVDSLLGKRDTDDSSKGALKGTQNSLLQVRVFV